MKKEININDEAYTNRELYLLLNSNAEKNELQHQAIITRLEELNKISTGTLDKLLAQTTRTNGRVSRLELWRSGIVACITLLAFLIPLAINYAK